MADSPPYTNIFQILQAVNELLALLKPTQAGRERRARRRYDRWLRKDKISRQTYAAILEVLPKGVIFYKPPPIAEEE